VKGKEESSITITKGLFSGSKHPSLSLSLPLTLYACTPQQAADLKENKKGHDSKNDAGAIFYFLLFLFNQTDFASIILD
jgi:hypothetical protein